jgi:hypothetical protein
MAVVTAAMGATVMGHASGGQEAPHHEMKHRVEQHHGYCVCVVRRAFQGVRAAPGSGVLRPAGAPRQERGMTRVAGHGIAYVEVCTRRWARPWGA